MKEIGPIAGINHKNTMIRISHAEGTDHQDIIKIIKKRDYYNTFQDHGNRRQYKKSYNDKHREENHKYKRSRDYYEDVYEHQYNRDEYEHQYKNESCHMPPHFQVQSTFVNHCDTYMVILPCMIQNDSFLKTNQ